jgi:acetyltransferase-like isoleucine patch superfamily enzyme
MRHTLSVIETDHIGSNVRVDEFSIIRHGAAIGDNVIIHPHVVIEAGVVIGNDVEIFPGTYIGKEPKGAGVTARPISFQPQVTIGDACVIGPHAVIFYDVEVGHHTLIGDGASLREQVRIGHHCLISRYVTINYNTSIGNHTNILDLTHITGNCTIGDNVFISVLVSTANDNNIVDRAYEGKTILGPQIGNNVTIGVGAILLPEVRIEEGAFVAAGAVVTKNVAAYDMVMGIPAKVARNLRTASQ